ncbi:ABC transporter permease [Achromobacter sp. ACM03]|jgi:peptide/nickel transport system permease protein|uniref:Dipeptide transport system permease protein DppB n=1 Tax=Achromobacter anxifer TaxID=1287737 RepID=A0A6S7CFK4_9BURK|nr:MULTISPECIES: ABC transporter permease [Achromobacter]MBD9431329.1 ABC transporter permease [Achromobacter sp. ACM03]MDF8360026.1 ABC transporter permease [Achromobacter anxifer]CAB3694995.1 Dipeptide transport system permease protein DppB [Achromobacter aegrifaciens]CAB3843474.1 Dipeptide transport system permease protein DppB [Achromobacter anxifer]CAB5515872.1 Dipeptide transport system permease protein DppB [Achromobacter anxifer]
MTAFIIRRLCQSVVILALTSLIVFAGVYAIGDPIEILVPADASQAEIAQAVASLGLDLPLYQQYLKFVGNALHGDLGTSFVYNQPAIQLILQRLPATLELAFVALLLALAIGLPLGLVAGLKPDSALDRGIMTGSILGFSLPNFWQGIMLVLIFSVTLGWLPSTGRGPTGEVLGIQTSLASWDGIRHLILPALNLALFKIALIVRLTRSGVRETMPLDYVKFARAKGLRESRVIYMHVLKNIMIPIVTVVGMEFGSMIAFATVTETIFAWPGVGKLIIDSIMKLDRPVVVAYLLIVVTMFILLNLLVDIIYSVLDPRVRVGAAE